MSDTTEKDMTVINQDGTETVYAGSHPIARAYRALQTAAERIGRNNCKSYTESAAFNKLPGIRRTNTQARRGHYTITHEHEEIVNAMPALLAGTITPEEAMALLHGYGVMQQRFPTSRANL